MVVNNLQRSLNTIEDIRHNARAQFHRKRGICTKYRITHGQTGYSSSHLLNNTRLLVTLNRSRISFKFNDLSHQTVISHSYQFVHTRSRHVVSYNHYIVMFELQNTYKVQTPSAHIRTCSLYPRLDRKAFLIFNSAIIPEFGMYQSRNVEM